MFRKAACLGAAFTILLAFGTLTVAAGGGCHPPAVTTEGSGQLVSIKNCSYSPSILHVPVGGTITWTNDDYLPHAVNGTGFDATDPYTSINPGTRVSHQFNIAGIYPYMCYVHPGMAGIVVVGDVALGGGGSATTNATIAAPVPASIVASSPTAAAAAPSVELPIAVALVVLSLLAGYAFARLPRRLRPRFRELIAAR
jgi:plastocyanin